MLILELRYRLDADAGDGPGLEQVGRRCLPSELLDPKCHDLPDRHDRVVDPLITRVREYRQSPRAGECREDVPVRTQHVDPQPNRVHQASPGPADPGQGGFVMDPARV